LARIILGSLNWLEYKKVTSCLPIEVYKKKRPKEDEKIVFYDIKIIKM